MLWLLPCMTTFFAIACGLRIAPYWVIPQVAEEASPAGASAPAAISEVLEACNARDPASTGASAHNGGGGGGGNDDNVGTFAPEEPAIEPYAGGGLDSPFANLALLLGLE